jgi:DUF2958 family protein
MELLLPEHRTRMLRNGRFNAYRRERGECEIDFKPVVKLFVPWGGGTWLLAFGLCDLGLGFPELGSVSLEEIAALTGPGNLTIERDVHFIAVKSLGAYAEEARLHERIIS